MRYQGFLIHLLKRNGSFRYEISWTNFSVISWYYSQLGFMEYKSFRTKLLLPRFGSCKICLKNFTLTVDQLAKISILRKHCRNFWLPYWGLIGRDLFINCISSQSLEFSFPSYEQTLKKILRLILYGAGRRPLATSLLAWLLCGLQYYKKLAPLIQKLVRSTCSKSKLCSVCM